MSGRRVLSGVLAVCLSSLLSGCWLQPGFDGGNTRRNPWEHKLTTANVDSLAKAWSVSIPSRNPSVTPPLVLGDRVFLTTSAGPPSGAESSAVVALDAATGRTVWERSITSDGIPVSIQRLTFVDGELWAGYWPQQAGTCPFGTVRLDRDGNVLGRDDSRFPLSHAIQGGRYVVEKFLTECPTDPIAWPPSTLTVRGVDTGETLWSIQPSSVGGSTIVAGDLVVDNTRAYRLAGCGAATCAPVWEVDLPGVSRLVGATPDSDVFYDRAPLFGPGGQVEAVSRETGASRWTAPYGGTSAQHTAIGDEYLYVLSGTRMLAFDVDGCGAPTCAPAWSAELPANGRYLVVAGDVVYAAAQDGLHTYRAGGCGAPTCPELGHVATGGGQADQVMTGVSVTGGRVFVMWHSAGVVAVEAYAAASTR
jgi:outer membrane protein assembly factor BamB